MSITIDGITFDQVAYDDDADVLYLHVGDPSTATDFAESAEGHAIRLGASGRVVGLTLLRPRYHLQKGDPVAITIPASARFQIDASVLGSVIHAANRDHVALRHAPRSANTCGHYDHTRVIPLDLRGVPVARQ